MNDVDGWKPYRNALSMYAAFNDHKIDRINIKILAQDMNITNVNFWSHLILINMIRL